MNVFGSSPDETRENIARVAREMSPLPYRNGVPVFPVEMIIDMGKGVRTTLPADELIENLTSNQELGERVIEHALKHGTDVKQLWLNYNVWRAMMGKAVL